MTTTESALAELLAALRARATIQRRVLDDLWHGGSRYAGHMKTPHRKMPHMIPGKDLATLTANSLELMLVGYSKGEAVAIALNVAGYRPPPEQPASITTH